MIKVFTGNEPYVIEYKVKCSTNMVAEDSINYLRYDTFNREVYTTCRQYPFLADKKVVVIRVNNLKELGEELISYISSPCKFTNLVIVVKKMDTRLKLYKELKKADLIEVCNKLDSTSVRNFVVRYVSKKEGRINQEAYDEFIKRINYFEIEDNNLFFLLAELDKLLLYAKDITLDDVKNVTGENVKENIYGLINYLYDKDFSGGVKQLNALINAGNNVIGILSLLQRSFRIIYKRALFPDIKATEIVPFGPMPRVLDKAKVERCIPIIDDGIRSIKRSIIADDRMLTIVYSKLYMVINN